MGSCAGVSTFGSFTKERIPSREVKEKYEIVSYLVIVQPKVCRTIRCWGGVGGQRFGRKCLVASLTLCDEARGAVL